LTGEEISIDQIVWGAARSMKGKGKNVAHYSLTPNEIAVNLAVNRISQKVCDSLRAI
jgi:hypothetical protein